MADPGEDPVPSETEPPGEPHPLDPSRHRPLDLDRAEGTVLLVGTRKGAWVLRADAARQRWDLAGPAFLGHIVNHFALDPRDQRTLLMAVRTGHLGPTVFRSNDLGKTWQEATTPPAFPKAPEGQAGRVVNHVFWLEPGAAGEPNVWYAGTSPPALFRSEDAGNTWAPISGWNDHPMWGEWTEDGDDGTPDGSILHSICVDPRDPAHLYVGISGGGIFESDDAGKDWRPFNQNVLADFKPDKYPEFGQDPHCVRLHPAAPDVVYQQNHCGIYRVERPDDRWERIGDNMPEDVGDIGFGIVLHPRDPRTAWVFPMDGTQVWPRTSPDGQPAVYVTQDSGKSWQRRSDGLPAHQAWYTVKRQAMAGDERDPAGVYFGTTSGEIWGSADEGMNWSCLARHLPHIYSVEAVELLR